MQVSQRWPSVEWPLLEVVYLLGLDLGLDTLNNRLTLIKGAVFLFGMVPRIVPSLLRF